MKSNLWIKESLWVVTSAFLILVAAELLKGHGRQASVLFSATWALLSTAIFIGTRLYYARIGQECLTCIRRAQDG